MLRRFEGAHMNSRSVIYTRIGDLLDQCKGCPENQIFHKGNRVSPEVICKDCTSYQEMRHLGNQLNHSEVIHLEMTVNKYRELRATFKTDTKICLEKNIDRNELKAWKKQHAEELLDIPMSGPKPGNKPSPNAKISKKMSDKLKVANAEIKRLKQEIAGKQSTVPTSSKMCAEYKAMKDKLLANISELTVQLEKATAEAKVSKEEVANLSESNHLFEERMNELQSDFDKVEQLENEAAQLTEQIDKATNEKNEAITEAGKLVSENNDLKQQLEYLRQDCESNKRFADDQYDEARRAKAQLIKLEAFVVEKLKPELAEV